MKLSELNEEELDNLLSHIEELIEQTALEIFKPSWIREVIPRIVIETDELTVNTEIQFTALAPAKIDSLVQEFEEKTNELIDKEVLKFLTPKAKD